jgi:HD-GYP domain-containing protein (c-di-GMP phosphodiesterase class II)
MELIVVNHIVFFLCFMSACIPLAAFIIIQRKIDTIKSNVIEIVFNSFDDAFILIDKKNHIKKYNKKAGELFPFLLRQPGICTTDSGQTLFVSLFASEFGIADKAPAEYETEGSIYEPVIQPLYDNTKKKQGAVLRLKNITSDKKNEQVLISNSRKLNKMVEAQTRQIYDMQDRMIIGFASLVESRNSVTGKHLRRTSSYVLIIATGLKFEGKYKNILTDDWIETLRKVAPLHDIGKISVPDMILDKPAKLTPEERGIMEQHTVHGFEMIETILKGCVNDSYLSMAADIARFHHEWWNGQGYPDKLSGESIPLEARIMAVADVFDALVTERPYKPAFLPEEAFRLIEEDAGKHFDPSIVQTFIDNQNIIEMIAIELQD